jgi:hypothetical protein
LFKKREPCRPDQFSAIFWHLPRAPTPKNGSGGAVVVQQCEDACIGQICKIYMVYYYVVRMTVPNQPTTVLFDIDGTLANIDHRRAFLTKEPPDWKAFNAEMGNDVPNPIAVSLYKALRNANSYELILVTGAVNVHER